jgi:flagellar motor switch protein FliM
MAEVLSSDEIDKLLAAVDAAYAADKKESENFNSESREEKFSREQLRGISMLHEQFARKAGASLTARLHRAVQMTVASVDQLTLGELYRTIPIPTTLGVINMEPLPSGAILEIDPAITFAMIDSMSGVKGKPPKPPHELTDSEKHLMDGIYVFILGILREAWSEIIDLRPQLAKIESDPQFIRLAPPAEMTALITFEAKIENTAGMLNFCIPYPVIEPMLMKFPKY